MNKLQKTILAVSLAILILVATVAPAAAQKVNEYEGQHYVTAEGDDFPDPFAKIKFA